MRRFIAAAAIAITVATATPSSAAALPPYCGYTAKGVIAWAKLHGPAPTRMHCALVTSLDWREYSKAVGYWSRR